MPSSFTKSFGHVVAFDVNSAFEQSAGILPSTADLAPSSVASAANLQATPAK